MSVAKNVRRKVRGAVEEVGGKVKKEVGKALGDDKMAAEGRATEVKGRLRQAAARTGERVEGAVQEAAGAAKKAVGKAVDDELMEAEGRAQELRGKTRRRAVAP